MINDCLILCDLKQTDKSMYLTSIRCKPVVSQLCLPTTGLPSSGMSMSFTKCSENMGDHLSPPPPPPFYNIILSFLTCHGWKFFKLVLFDKTNSEILEYSDQLHLFDKNTNHLRQSLAFLVHQTRPRVCVESHEPVHHGPLYGNGCSTTAGSHMQQHY